MCAEKAETKKSTTHDFFSDKKCQYLLLGFAQSRNVLYFVYKGLVILFIAGLTFMAIYGAVLIPSKRVRVDTLHYCLLGGHAIWGQVTRIVTHRSLNRTKKIVQYGIYHYKDEEEDEEELRMKERIPGEVSSKFNFYLYMCLCGLVSNQIFFPLSQLNAITQDDFIIPDGWMNPYLPHILYMPFDTRSVFGYCIAHLLDSIFYSSLYFTTLSMCLIFISMEVQIKIHLQVLSHSVENIQKRAMYRYKRIMNARPDQLIQEQMYENKVFQSCLASCLKANIQHHQALLGLLKESKPFLSSSMFVFFALDATIRATVLYSILLRPRFNLTLNYFLTFLAESAYSYQVCTLGQELIEESDHLYNSLYNISWFEYGKSFNKTLHIMMSNIQKPIQFKAMLLGIPASLDTYATLFSGMYKITNLVRQSDSSLKKH